MKKILAGRRGTGRHNHGHLTVTNSAASSGSRNSNSVVSSSRRPRQVRAVGYVIDNPFISLDALEGAPVVENRPGDAGELVR